MHKKHRPAAGRLLGGHLPQEQFKSFNMTAGDEKALALNLPQIVSE